jgi:hypothetical protein
VTYKEGIYSFNLEDALKRKKPTACVPIDREQLLQDIQSPDEQVRARAVRSLCPCHAGWEVFETHLDVVSRLTKDPDREVRKNALHVFEDAGEMESGGYPTNPREATNEMLRRKRASRFRREEEDYRETQNVKKYRR